MKILITGMAGFIGFHLCKKLLHAYNDIHIVGIDNINDYYDPNLKVDRLKVLGFQDKAVFEYGILTNSSTFNNCTFMRLDLENADMINALFKAEEFDYVINLAAQAGVRYSLEHPQKYISSNIVGFYNILQACKDYNIKHFIYASSSSVYGNSKKEIFSTDDVVNKPVSLYASTKLCNEHMAYTYSHLYSLPTTGLRFFTVYGPWGRPDMAYYSFTEKIYNNHKIKIFNGGDLYRDFTYIDDIVNGISLLLTVVPKTTDDHACFALHNIGNQKPENLGYFISCLEQLIGKKAIKEYVEMQPGDVYRTSANIDSLKKAVDFAPNTNLYYGLERFVQWYLEYNGIQPG